MKGLAMSPEPIGAPGWRFGILSVMTGQGLPLEHPAWSPQLYSFSCSVSNALQGRAACLRVAQQHTSSLVWYPECSGDRPSLPAPCCYSRSALHRRVTIESGRGVRVSAHMSEVDPRRVGFLFGGGLRHKARM